MKTNVKTHPVFTYLTNQLPTAEDINQQYAEKVPDTIPARLQFVVDCFNSEYNHESNRKRYGNTVNVFAQWLQGIPSIFSVEYRNHAILELAKELESISENATEREEEKILSNWFNFAALKFAQLCKFNKVQF